MVADRHAGEQRVEVGGDHLFEGYETLAVGHDHEARQGGRHLHPGDAALPRGRILHLDHEVERQVRDVGERMTRVDRQRGEDRVDLALEDVDEVLAVVVIEGGPVGETDVRLCERGHDEIQEDVVLAPDQLFDAGPDHGQLLARAQAVDAARAHARRHLVLQRRHPYLVELVQQLGEDGEELGPLEQRLPVVLGQIQESRTEVEA